MLRFNFSAHFGSMKKMLTRSTCLGHAKQQNEKNIISKGLKTFHSCHRYKNTCPSFHLMSYGRTHQTGRVTERCFSTCCVRFSSETQGGEKTDKTTETENKPLTQRQKLARIFAAYGSTAVVFHTGISLTSLGICYTIVSSGIDMVSLLQKVGIASEAGLQSTLASGASTFVIAYACHKVFMPVRVFLTVTCTPIIVRKLRSIGILKEKAAGQ